MVRSPFVDSLPPPFSSSRFPNAFSIKKFVVRAGAAMDRRVKTALKAVAPLSLGE